MLVTAFLLPHLPHMHGNFLFYTLPQASEFVLLSLQSLCPPISLPGSTAICPATHALIHWTKVYGHLHVPHSVLEKGDFK